MRNKQGFTLLELIIVVLIMIIVVSMSAPGLEALAQNNRATSITSELKRKLLFARSHSSNTLNYVTVCPLVNNICTDDWSTGVDVFIDTNQDKIYTAIEDDEILNEGAQIHLKDQLVFSASNKGVTFSPEGQLTNGNDAGTFTYCSGDKRAGIQLAFSGYPKRMNGNALGNCP